MTRRPRGDVTPLDPLRRARDRLRAGLADAVAKHPALVAPDNQARAAAMLARLDSTEKRMTDKPEKPKMVTLRITPEIVALLDTEVERLSAEQPAGRFSRDSVGRDVLRSALVERGEQAKVTKRGKGR